MGMREEVREAMDQANQEFFGKDTYHVFSTVTEKSNREAEANYLQAMEI